MSSRIYSVQSVEQHSSSIIFMHGLGDNGYKWQPYMSRICPPHMQALLPTAPEMPVTLNAGFKMTCWFDLKAIGQSAPEDGDGIRKSGEFVHSLIKSQIDRGIPANRIIVGGFSQGGALALYSGLTYPEKLGGVIALSCWLPLHREFPNLKVCPDDLPIFQAHGYFDPVVPYNFGELSSIKMKGFMKDVTFMTYGMSHSCDALELNDVKEFIEKHVGAA